MKILRHITLFFSVASLLFLTLFLPQTLTLNLYIAFTLLFSALQGVFGLLAPPNREKAIKEFLMDWEINLSFRLIRIGLTVGLVRAFIVHGVEADSAAQIASVLGLFNGFATLFALGLLLYFSFFYDGLLRRTEASDEESKAYAVKIYRTEMATGLALYLLSCAFSLWMATPRGLPYMTAIFILWIAPTLLGAFGRAMVLAKNSPTT
ncbi:MAG: hypothetical protein KDK48_01850 [Chlamydiia bacterium]|nr:hypothetical protein [Chlamydiia bacterium]